MDFSLTPPEPVAAIPAERAAGLITLSEDTRSEVTVRASEFASRLEALDVRSPEFTDLLDELLTVGEADMRAAAGVAGTMLDRSLRSAASPQDGVTTSLASLRRTVAELDPAKLPLTGRKLLGVFPAAAGAKRAAGPLPRGERAGQRPGRRPARPPGRPAPRQRRDQGRARAAVEGDGEARRSGRPRRGRRQRDRSASRSSST